MKNIINVLNEKISQIKIRIYCDRLAREWKRTDAEKVMEDSKELLPDLNSFEITDDMSDDEISEVIKSMAEAMKPGIEELRRRAKAGIYRV